MKIVAALLGLAFAGALVFGGLLFKERRAASARRMAEDVALQKADAERMKAELAKAQAEAELAKLRLEQEKNSIAAAKLAAEAKAEAEAKEAAEKTRLAAADSEKVKARVQKTPGAWALWEETDHSLIKMLSVRPADVTVSHKGKKVTAKYEDLPEWLRTAALARFKDEGEANGMIREVNGKTYDVRKNPAGWILLPLAEVFQIVDDGYLMVDVAAARARIRVFKLKHNGLGRVLNVGDRIQLNVMSAGTYSYRNKAMEIETVPVYDPGLPVGPLRERVVAMKAPKSVKEKTNSDDQVTKGSGFFISDDGLFISNAHVVEDAKKVEVKTAAGRKSATVLKVDRDKDLALLRVSVAKGSVPALAISTNRVVLGTGVFTIGYPMVDLQGSRPKFTDGRISSVAGLRDDPNEMQISVAVQPGNSGGPLVDNNGDIVGVVVARLDDLRVIEVAGVVPQNVNFAVKGETLFRFLRENRDLVSGVKLGRSARRTQEEAVQLVEKASGLVEAFE